MVKVPMVTLFFFRLVPIITPPLLLAPPPLLLGMVAVARAALDGGEDVTVPPVITTSPFPLTRVLDEMLICVALGGLSSEKEYPLWCCCCCSGMTCSCKWSSGCGMPAV